MGAEMHASPAGEPALARHPDPRWGRSPKARAAWPEKLIWSNINVGVYQLPAAELRRLVVDRAAEGAPDGRRLAFEVSEHLPADWRRSMPVVLDALNEMRG